jgi:chloramphenicol-sensitive protein RarD
VETVLIAPVALLFLAAQGGGALGAINGATDALLLAAGPITVFPLLMFLLATQRLRLSTVGLIQYLTPTLQFLLAVAVYREPFTAIHLIAFGCIWLALALYSRDAWLDHRTLRKAARPPTDH